MVDLFAKVGLGQWFRYFTGLLEIAAGIGLLIPAPSIAHITVLGSSPAAPVVLFVLTGIIAYLRKPYASPSKGRRT